MPRPFSCLQHYHQRSSRICQHKHLQPNTYYHQPVFQRQQQLSNGPGSSSIQHLHQHHWPTRARPITASAFSPSMARPLPVLPQQWMTTTARVVTLPCDHHSLAPTTTAVNVRTETCAVSFPVTSPIHLWFRRPPQHARTHGDPCLQPASLVSMTTAACMHTVLPQR